MQARDTAAEAGLCLSGSELIDQIILSSNAAGLPFDKKDAAAKSVHDAAATTEIAALLARHEAAVDGTVGVIS